MNISFYKYEGTGNDFIILDNRSGLYSNLTTHQIAWLCHRKFGIGADGLMLMGQKENYDFEMIYYNADGNTSTMCGNGGRCMVKFAFDLGIHQYTYKFLAVDGPHEAEIDNDNAIRLKMTDVKEVDQQNGYTLLDTGSPHFVKFVNKIEEVDVVESGRIIRESKPFAENGINVNFVETFNKDSIYVRTYERGVEDETMSCGTGVTASALVSAHNERGFNRVEVKTNGGKLSVEFNKKGDGEFDNIWLCGPANFVFKGEVIIKDN
jgi:diaminopimelate epimerase